MKKSLLILMAAMAIFAFVGCASNEGPTTKDLEATKTTEILEHQGSALGLTGLPSWIETYIYQGVSGLEELDAFKDTYCFVAEATDPTKDAALMWAKNFNMAQTIAGTISTRVKSLFEGTAENSDDEYVTEFTNEVNSYIDAEVVGAKNEAEWWVQHRRYNPDDKDIYEDTYTAYVLYTVPREILDDQLKEAVDKLYEDDDLVDAEKAVLDAAKAMLEEKGLPVEK